MNKNLGDWCPYKDFKFCQESDPCTNCQIYIDTMPIPWDRKEEVMTDSPANNNA